MADLSLAKIKDAEHEITIPQRPINVASVPQLSVFRYPGGKTWLIPEIRAWLAGLGYRPSLFVEPFAGGGIASLTAVIEDYVDEAVLCELDSSVAAVWETILTDDTWLCERIANFRISRDEVQRVLEHEVTGTRDIAFQTLLRNRTQRGGIIAPGATLMRNGENGRGVASRWYPDTLIKRIKKISDHRDRIRFIHGDGLEVIREYQKNQNVVFFVDPPYTAGGKKAGKRLYTHNDLDHDLLFSLLAQAECSVLMTYDDAPEVIALAERYQFHLQRVPMKNAHNSLAYELLITNQTSMPARQRTEP